MIDEAYVKQLESRVEKLESTNHRLVSLMNMTTTLSLAHERERHVVEIVVDDSLPDEHFHYEVQRAKERIAIKLVDSINYEVEVEEYNHHQRVRISGSL